jgi:dephospho-CoA kinase
MIIGLTGTYGSGKDTVAEYIEKEKHFKHYSLSDELRRELEKRGIATVRENLIRVGTELRGTEGSAVLAKRVCARLTAGVNYVITSIRHPAEINELKKHGGFYMVNIDAPAEKRFSRIRRRDRPGDPQTLEQLLEMEKKESQTSGPGQQLGECRKLADFTLVNDKDSLGELYAAVDRMLESSGYPG